MKINTNGTRGAGAPPILSRDAPAGPSAQSVPLLDLKAQNGPLKEKILKAIEEVFDSNQFILGPWVERFEKEAAGYIGAKHAIGVSSGTDALLVSLMALSVGPGDAVITTAFSFFATAGVVVRAGARPYFADIEEETYNLDPASAAAAVEKARADGFEVKAIIPVHLYGQCARMQEIMEVAGRYGLKVIEDAAQALGAQCPVDGAVKNAGTIGDLGCFSFFPSKNLGCLGDGGLVTSGDDALAERVRLLRTHGARPKYYHALVGGNFRLDALQAAVLLEKLPYLNAWHEGRRANARRYRELFARTGLIEKGLVELPGEAYPGVKYGHIYNQFVLRVKNNKLKNRDGLREYLNRKRIGNEVYYPVPFHLQQCFAHLGYRLGDFPRAERAAEELIAIPVYPELTREQQEYVVKSIEEYFAAKE